MHTQVIFLGPPGSGKGTQAAKLSEEESYKHISTGDLLRKEMSKKSALGQKVSDVVNNGRLVDDQTVLELLKANCDIHSGKFIFDGFPRNIEQAKMLDKAILSQAPQKTFYFEIDLGLLAQRLTNRRTCKDCGAIFNLALIPPKKPGICDNCGGRSLTQRKDDVLSTVQERLKVFQDAVEPMLEFYRKKGTLVVLDAAGEVETIYDKIADSL